MILTNLKKVLDQNKKKGIEPNSQHQLADKTEIDVAHINRMTNGASISTETASRIAGALDMAIELKPSTSKDTPVMGILVPKTKKDEPEKT